MTFANALATKIVKLEMADLPDRAVQHAKMLVASTVASAALGFELDSTRIVREAAQDKGGRRQATVWFADSEKLPAVEAARANAVASDAAASDDSDLRSIMHCGTPLVATAVALAEATGASGSRVISGIVLGYEAAGRIHDAVPCYRKRGFHGSTLTIFCAAVAAGYVLGLDDAGMTNALALAATSTGSLSKSAETSVAREYHAGQAVANGIQAALLAKRGLTGEPRIFELPGGFFSSYGGKDGEDACREALDRFGTSWDVLTDLAIKLMPGAHPFHTFAEAASEAVRSGNVRAEDIASIRVCRPGLIDIPGPRHPHDHLTMAHSAAYFLAAGAAQGKYSWENAEAERIADPVIHGLIDKVEVGSPQTWNLERHRYGATVTIATVDGQVFTSAIAEPKGSATRGISWDDIDEKYRRLVRHSSLDSQAIESSLDDIHQLEDLSSIDVLTGKLGGSRHAPE